MRTIQIDQFRFGHAIGIHECVDSMRGTIHTHTHSRSHRIRDGIHMFILIHSVLCVMFMFMQRYFNELVEMRFFSDSSTDLAREAVECRYW